MTLNRHQAVGAYQRWNMESFDAPEPVTPPPQPEALVEEALAPPEPPPLQPAPEDIPPDPDIRLPTAADVEGIHEEARKEGYAAGYEEGTARGRVEAMHFHGLVENLEKSLAHLDSEVAEELLSLATELARQMVKQTIAAKPDALLDLIREALLLLPQGHAMVHIHPDDLAMAKEYLGEQLTHAGHRLVEDATVTRGGCRIEAAGSQIDATVQTRWRRIMDNLGRNVPWDGDA